MEKYFSFLPTEPAATICKDLIEQLDTHKNLCLDNKSSDSENFFSTERLFTQGHMFGILTCIHPETKERIILKAFSGQYFGSWNCSGWTPSLIDEKKYIAHILSSDSKIKEITNEILLCKKNDPYNTKKIATLKQQRKKYSQDSLKTIYKLYRFTNNQHQELTFEDIAQYFFYEEKDFISIPTGTGDCCAPKLFSYAYKNNLIPESLAEFYYGKETATKKHKEFYPPCREKCRFILPLLLGLDIIYRDDSIVVINKHSGLLSVPGRGPDKQDSVVSRLKLLIPDSIEQPSVHRLDMETSGLMVYALTKEAHRLLSIDFMNGKVKKQYIALLDGSLYKSSGTEAQKAVKKACSTKEPLQGKIILPFRLDVENRPYQIYDEEFGKVGETLWQSLGEEKLNNRKVTRILFIPLTGRTHQLRLHSMHEKGLGLPIVGDSLYGTKNEKDKRMMLHASLLEFQHPITKEIMTFSLEADF